MTTGPDAKEKCQKYLNETFGYWNEDGSLKEELFGAKEDQLYDILWVIQKYQGKVDSAQLELEVYQTQHEEFIRVMFDRGYGYVLDRVLKDRQNG